MTKKRQNCSKLSILLVDDSKTQLTEAKKIIEDIGYSVITAENGIAALEYLSKTEKNLPSLIISDIVMPEMDGFELCSKVREKYGQQIPVIMLTVHNDDGMLKKAYNSGALDYIEKPVTKTKLITRINKTFQIYEKISVDSRIIESTAEGICLIDLDNNIIRVNKAFEKMAGLTRGKILNKKCYEVLSCQDCNTADCRLALIKKNKRTIKKNILKKTTAGKHIFCSLTAVPFFNIQGEMQGIIETFIDRSEKNRIEKELLLKSSIVDNSLIALNAMDIEGRINFANEFFIKTWGYNKDSDVLNRPLSYFLKNPERAENILNELQKKKLWIGEFTGIKKDDSTFNLFALATAVTDKSGKIIGYQSSCFDITERKKIRLAMEKSETRFKELFNRMGSGVAIYEPINNGNDFLFKDLNKAGCVLSKTTRQEVIGKKITEAFPSVEKFGLLNVLKKVWKTGKAQEHPTRLYQDSKLESWCENFVYKLPAGEIVAIYDDVTPRERSKEMLLDSKHKLEKLTNQLHKNLMSTVFVLANTVEYRDKYTAGHSKNVSNLACAIGEELGLMAENIESLKMAGVLHDIGKIAIPSKILKKITPLTKEEFDLIKTHPQVGYELIKLIDFPSPVAKIILQHHERINGSGYPNGEKGVNLLLESKILAVADVVEAMSLPRPYRKALGIDKALKEISDNSDILYDADVVKACIRLFREKGYKIE